MAYDITGNLTEKTAGRASYPCQTFTESCLLAQLTLTAVVVLFADQSRR